MKEWMTEDLIDKLDLSGLLDLDEQAVRNTVTIRKELNDRISLLENNLYYTEFLIRHHKDIVANEEKLSSITDEATKLCILSKQLLKDLPSGEQQKVDAYFNFFDSRPESIRILPIRCGDYAADIPENPFPTVEKFYSSKRKGSFSLEEQESYDKILLSVNQMKDSAEGIVNTASLMVKYNISDEYPLFDDQKIGMMEYLLGSSVTDTSSSELSHLNDALSDLKDQLDCVNQILDELES